MERNPLLSVVVPVYNVEKYLRCCIESIINQTYQNLEIILVDDGSTDSCGTICDEYQKVDSRIKVIHKKNAGQGLARNSGIEVATGEYIAFVDADDSICAQMYEILIRAARENDADISCCTRMMIDEDEDAVNTIFDIEHELERISFFSGHDATKELLQSHKKIKNAVWEKIYKKELFENIKFRSVYAEDREIMYKLLYNAKVVTYLPLKLYCYRQRIGSTMNSNWNEHKDKMVHEQDQECTEFFLTRKEIDLVEASIYWHFLWGIENYRRLEGEDSKYRERLSLDMQKYGNWKYLKSTGYPIRRKIEFFVFAKNPKLHYKICNLMRFFKGVSK